jgi:hypothetical protein
VRANYYYNAGGGGGGGGEWRYTGGRAGATGDFEYGGNEDEELTVEVGTTTTPGIS